MGVFDELGWFICMYGCMYGERFIIFIVVVALPRQEERMEPLELGNRIIPRKALWVIRLCGDFGRDSWSKPELAKHGGNTVSGTPD